VQRGMVSHIRNPQFSKQLAIQFSETDPSGIRFGRGSRLGTTEFVEECAYKGAQADVSTPFGADPQGSPTRDTRDACAPDMRGPFEAPQVASNRHPCHCQPAITPSRSHVSATGPGTYANRRSQDVPGGNSTWTPSRPGAPCSPARRRSSASICAHSLGAATRGRRFRRGSRFTGWPRHDWASTACRPHTRRPVRWRAAARSASTLPTCLRNSASTSASGPRPGGIVSRSIGDLQ
jgi:hypothetical protein